MKYVYIISLIVGKVTMLWVLYDLYKQRKSGIRKPTEEELEKFRNVK